MKYDDYTGREEALLHAWDESNSPAVDWEALKVRLLFAYQAEAASPRALDPQDDELDAELPEDAVSNDIPAALPGASASPIPASAAPTPAPAPAIPTPTTSMPLPTARPARWLASLRLCPNEEWPGIIDVILAGRPETTYRRARSLMWQQVDDYVVHHVKLPIGPLGDDEDVRRDISVRVLRKLEANSYCHLREWERRQAQKRDHASFWGWIKVVVKHVSIDYARTSRRNLARRGEPFRWAVVDSVDPFVLAETCDRTDELREFLARAQALMRKASADETQPSPRDDSGPRPRVRRLA